MDIFTVLEKAADKEASAGMSAYMRNQFEFLGIKKPIRAQLTKSFLAQKKKQPIDWEFVDACYARSEREFHYLAVDYVRVMADKLLPQDLKRIERLITHHSWWDTVDSLTRPVGCIFLKFPQAAETINGWMQSDNIWLRRMSIIFQLHFKKQTDTAFLSKAIEANLGSKEFFINKAIGWALREYSKTDPQWVRSFLGSHILVPLSVREASKYI